MKKHEKSVLNVSCLWDKVIHQIRLTQVLARHKILPEQQQHNISMNQLRKMIYCTSAQQQLCVGNKALAPKLFMRHNEGIVAVCGRGRNSGKTELRRRKCAAQSERFSVRWKIGHWRARAVRFHAARRAESLSGRKDFLRNSETSASACFGEPVCSVMLFWPVDTSSSAATKGDAFDERRETAFKQHILNILLRRLHLLCSPSFEFASCPRATALTRLPAMVFGHTAFTTLSLQLGGQQRSVNTPVTIAAHCSFLDRLQSVELHLTSQWHAAFHQNSAAYRASAKNLKLITTINTAAAFAIFNAC